MSVHCFVAGDFDSAADFYRLFPREPRSKGSWIEIASVEVIAGLTLAELLDQVAARCHVGDEVVVASHSTDQGLGFPIGLGSTKHFNRLHLEQLANALLRPEAARGEARDQFATYLEGSHDDGSALSSDGARRLFERVDAVRAVGLKAVHFRGCNLGVYGDEAVKPFCTMFGCGEVTALQARSGYAPAGPVTLLNDGEGDGEPVPFDAVFDRIPEGTNFCFNTYPERGAFFGFDFVELPNSKILVQHIFARDEVSARAWIARCLPPPAAPIDPPFRIAVHGLIVASSLILPGAWGKPNPDYAERIVLATSGVG